tara:strand:+ start:424 stop:669 length:246 start_codon:yes stop_codon:yes gene_type:complete
MTLEIKYPRQSTYFICREDDMYTITAHGVVEPNQCMLTGQPIMDQYLDRAEWEAILTAAGIDPLEAPEKGATYCSVADPFS